MATSSDAPQPVPQFVDKNSFLFKKILRHNPQDALNFCTSFQKQWTEEYSKDRELSERMLSFKKTRCMQLVWVSDKFGGSLSDDISELKTYCLLSGVYDAGGDAKQTNATQPCSDTHQAHSHAEVGRKSELQLLQHMKALLYSLEACNDKAPLSEKLIKEAHRILMNDLYTGDMVR